MKKKYICSYAVLLLAAVCLTPVVKAQETASAKREQAPQFFPLKVGNYWLYQGFRRWMPAGSNRFLEEPVTWKMEVVEVISREFITAAIIKGHPQEGPWREEGSPQGNYLFLAIGEDRYYFLQGVRVAEVIARLNDEHDILANLVFEDELFLTVPQTSGVAQDESTTADQSELSHEWVVTEEKEIATTDQIRPADPRFRKKFRLVFKALPNHTSIDFVPGVGITHYTYYHEGIVAEADLRLVEYFAG